MRSRSLIDIFMPLHSEKGIPQINERYILTRTFSIIFGVVYGVRHLIYQKDWLAFPEIQVRAWTTISEL